MQMRGRVLIVAGSDSRGGAGIQAHIKAVTADRRGAAAAIVALGAQAVLIKGGHGSEDPLVDLLVENDKGGERATEFTSARLDTRHTHGTGCTLASAIATGLAQGLALAPAVDR